MSEQLRALREKVNARLQSSAVSRDRAKDAGRDKVAACRQSDVETCEWFLSLLRDTAALAAPAASSAATDGAALIAAERERQQSVEGWMPEHDDEHANGELADAAACYAAWAALQAQENTDGQDQPPTFWPWDERWWKPRDAIRNLVRAGALIAAEIDRLTRAARSSEPSTKTGEG
jgi:hypothetical protein